MTEVKSVFPFRFLFLMHRWKEKQDVVTEVNHNSDFPSSSA